MRIKSQGGKWNEANNGAGALIVVFVFIVLIFMPFIIDKIYDWTPPIEFFYVELSKSDILDYYANYFIFTLSSISKAGLS